MSETPVVNQIQHYQRSIEKYPDDELRVLRCIRKLDELKVTVQHLKVTGVGRTVNALRKYDGTVGNASKALVSKWKIMVVDEGSSDYDDDDDNCAPDVSGGYSDNSDSGVDKDENHIPTSSGHKSSESRERHSNSNSRNESRSSKNSPNNSSELSRSKLTSRSNGNSDDNRHHSKSSSSNHQNKSEDSNTRLESREKKSKSSRESSSKSDKDRDNSKRDESVNHSSYSSISSSSKIKKDKESKVSSNEYAKHNGSSSDRKRKHDGLANEKHQHKRRRSGESVDESEEDNKSLDDTNEINNEMSDSEYDKIQIKSESPEPRRNSSKEVAVKKEKLKDKAAVAVAAATDGVDKLKEEKHKHSSSSSKHKVKSDSKSSENRKHDKKKDESSSKFRTSNDPSSSRDTTDKNKHGEKSKDKKSEKDKDKSKDKDKDKKHKEKKIKINGKEGIDCNSGTSFAEALGMCTASTSFSRKKNVSPNISKSTKSEASTSSQKSSKIKTESFSPKEEQPLSLLSPSIKLEPLNVDLASTLPEISANYKPLPVNHMNPIYQKPEKVDEAAALNQAMNNKNKRSKVYSGNKTGSGLSSVPSLYDLCIRVLIQNIDAIEDTGEVPYYILSPVLKQATAEQLYQVEHYNGYLIAETDDLWKFHCNREFRNKEPGENETWRELYIRSLDEREAKLNKLTGIIKKNVEVKEKDVKSTKLAYVDEFVKPPRNILKKQTRYGTSTATSSSDMKKKLILTTGNNAPTDIAVPAPPMSRVKSSTSGIVKKGKAPLMAKALQLIKGRYKR